MSSPLGEGQGSEKGDFLNKLCSILVPLVSFKSMNAEEGLGDINTTESPFIVISGGAFILKKSPG